MSRSRKKTPGFSIKGSGSKRMANRKLRKLKDIPEDGGYKKAYPQWDIYDYKSLAHNPEELESWPDPKDKYRAYMK